MDAIAEDRFISKLVEGIEMAVYLLPGAPPSSRTLRQGGIVNNQLHCSRRITIQTTIAIATIRAYSV